MTSEQVYQAYQEYKKAEAECDKADCVLTAAARVVGELQAELEAAERKVERAWKEYERFLKANQI